MGHTRYASLKLIQGTDEYAEFEKAVYPDKDGPFLNTPHYDKAWEFLMKYEHGEVTMEEVFGDTSTEFPYIYKWDYEPTDQNDTHVIIWNPARGCAAIWRKIEQDC